MSPLVLILAGAAMLVVIAVAGIRGRYRLGDPLRRRARALDALRHIAEHPQPIEVHATHPKPDPSDAVRILDPANLPSNVRPLPYRRKVHPSRRHVVQRPHSDEVALRRTVARLPTPPSVVRRRSAKAQPRRAEDDGIDLDGTFQPWPPQP